MARLSLASRLLSGTILLALSTPTMAQDGIPVLEIPSPDLLEVAAEDHARQLSGLPPRFAIPNSVQVSPDSDGLWEPLDNKTMRWQMLVRAPGAASINLGFTRYQLPAGGQLLITAPDRSRSIRPFTADDNEEHGELWTPVLLGEELLIELTLPNRGLNLLDLELTHVGYGYRGFGAKKGGTSEKSGSCNVDVVCPIADPWIAEVPSVGVISTGGSTFCTGFMVNNTASDRAPYFMTANHCGIGSGTAASLVVYWNYETSVCGGSPDGVLSDFQTGSFFRSSYSPSDFSLVLLDDDPDSAWGVTYAGWDRSGAEATTAIAIHHPNTDEKRISFEYQSTTTTSYLGSSVPGDGTHVRIIDWDVGTTEPGSSGSPVFDQDHRVIGQLHGGGAACGNDLSDWYGRFSVSWAGGGSNSSRLSNWLDPGGTGAMTIDTLGSGMGVSPRGPVSHDGPIGGPFTDPSLVYTLTNQTTSTINYKVSLTNNIGILIDGGTADLTGSISPGGNKQVTVSLGSSTTTLGIGVHSEQVRFEDLSNSITSIVDHDIVIGTTLAFSFPFDSDPGWAKQGQWAFGTPTGGGGVAHGEPDPTSGHTGSNVLGYNLAGDYPDNLAERHLTSGAIDCSDLSNVQLGFQRWLNVEQPLYDHAYVRVSTNGSSWTTVWENGSEITDTSWNEQSIDISSLADGQPTVFLRWTMGTTDSSWQYAGWNIDDVTISGILSFTQYGSGCQGTAGLIPELNGSGDASPGGAVTITIENGLASGGGLIFVSSSPGSIPLAGGCTYLLGAFAQSPAGVGLDGAGAATLNGTIPVGTPSGTQVFLQYLGLDSGAGNGSYSMSNGLDILVE